MAKTMKAMQAKSYGPTAKLELVDLPMPSAPKDNQVLIQVKATSINPVDNKILRENIGLNPDLPAILHCDVAGVVTAVGPKATKFKVGDEVYGCCGGFKNTAGGGLAGYMLADAGCLAIKPKNFDFKQTAALPTIVVTAYVSLFDKCGLKSGQHTLIHAGAGGVGHAAIQLAKLRGAKVSTTISGDAKAKLAMQCGADNCINYREKSVEQYVKDLTGGEGFDVVLDTVGGDTMDKSLLASRFNGDVATIVGLDKHDVTPAFVRNLSLHFVNVSGPVISNMGNERHGQILAECTKYCEEGKFKPILHDKVFKLSEANEAHAFFESGKAVGKIIISHE